MGIITIYNSVPVSVMGALGIQASLHSKRLFTKFARSVMKYPVEMIFGGGGWTMKVKSDIFHSLCSGHAKRGLQVGWLVAGTSTSLHCTQLPCCTLQSSLAQQNLKRHFFFFFFQGQPTNSMGSEHLKTTRSCMDTPINMYSSKGHIKRLTGTFFLADIQTMTYTQVHRYLGHASMFLLTLHRTITVCG